jgi:hypothetical protein
MTIEQCKRELPAVRIAYNGKIWTARVSGRLNQFASVSPHTRTNGKRVETIIGPIFHFSWDAVARAASENRVLKV